VVETPSPRVTAADIEDRHCEHCQARTPQVKGEADTCLQCIADGGTCCSLDRLNRWEPPAAGGQ
jgi:hypothetical protein